MPDKTAGQQPAVLFQMLSQQLPWLMIKASTESLEYCYQLQNQEYLLTTPASDALRPSFQSCRVLNRYMCEFSG